MPQVFHRSTNTLSRLSIFGAVFLAGGLLWVSAAINRSGWVSQQGVARAQPVPFSHQHHAGELGIDCRYCHTSVEVSATASIPPTQTCMNCHSQIWADSPTLAPVRDSFRTGASIEWVRVNDLPGYVYFNHSIHVFKGIGCVSCHGRVDRLNLLYQSASLHMEWCLDCHRHPEQHVRPRSEVFNMAWEPPIDQLTLGTRLVADHQIERRDDCTTCHR